MNPNLINPVLQEASSAFEPDYRHFEAVMANRKPARLPLYEHYVDTVHMERILGCSFAAADDGTLQGADHFFAHYCRFFREMTYDIIPFEQGLARTLPGHGALQGGMAGPIQDVEDFAAYPWDELEERYWKVAGPRFDALVRHLPEGMKIVGGIGNGVFELAEDLVGLEYLPFMQVDEPDLYEQLFEKIGDLLVRLWVRLLDEYGPAFCACRFGDDLGFKSSLLTNPGTVRSHIVPQYQKLVSLIHDAGRPFLWHSCGCIFEIMEDVLAVGIDAKHSNEDAIAPYDRWIQDYGDRIGLCGGFDMDFLCRATPEEVQRRVYIDGRRFRSTARGYALGSGNSIADYLPTENFLAMVEAVVRIRQTDNQAAPRTRKSSPLSGSP